MSVYTGNNFHLVYYLKSAVNATAKAKSLTKRIQKHITEKLYKIQKVKELKAKGLKQKKIAKELKISKATVSLILNNRY